MVDSPKPFAASHDADSDVARIRRTVLIVCLVSSFVNPFIGTSLNIALPRMANELHLSAATTPWVLTIFMLASSTFMLPMGRLADIYGRKKIFAIGWGLFSITSLLVALSVNGPMLLTLRVFQGISGSMFLGAAVGILSSVFPRDERGRVLGLSISAQYAGSSVGPALGGALTQHFGWRSIYLTMVPVALLMSILIVKNVKTEWADARGETLDVTGSVMYGTSLALIMYGVSRLPNLVGLGPMAAGLIVLGVFVWWEGRVNGPVLDVRLFRGHRVFALANLAALINFSASSSSAFLLSLYLQNVKGFTPQTAGLIMMAQPVAQALLSAPAGQLSDRTGAHRLIASFGMAVTAAALFLFSRLGAHTSIWAVISILVLLGVGFALFAPPNMSMVMNSVEKRHYGVASALVTTMRQVGSMLSSGLSAVIFALYLGEAPINPDIAPMLTRSIKVTFALCGAVCLAGVIVCLSAGGRWPESQVR